LAAAGPDSAGGRLLLGRHGKALTVEDGGFAGSFVLHQDGADFRRCSGVAKRAGNESQLHASPVLLSLITMIGRNVVSDAFGCRLEQPAPQRRRPPTEFAPPTSTPNSVRCTASLDAAAWDDPSASASSAGEVACNHFRHRRSGDGFRWLFRFRFAQLRGRGIEWAIIDLDGISGVAGVAAGRI